MNYCNIFISVYLPGGEKRTKKPVALQYKGVCLYGIREIQDLK